MFLTVPKLGSVDTNNAVLTEISSNEPATMYLCLEGDQTETTVPSAV